MSQPQPEYPPSPWARRQARKRLWLRGAAVVVVIAVAVVAGLIVVQSRHDPQNIDGAKAAGARMEAAANRHDAGAFWDFFTSSGKEVMSRSDYIYVADHCAALFAPDPIVALVLNHANTVGSVTATGPEGPNGGAFQWFMIYEHGYWKHQPTDATLVWMSLSGSDAAAYLNASGDC